VRTTEVRDVFAGKYRTTKGVISGERKNLQFVMVTTTSALGRSSLYNRLRLHGVTYFERAGFTEGYGHFQVPPDLFEDIREYLALRKCSYADGNRFGNGPNWRFRVIRAALELIGIDRDLLRHGIRREVFISRLAKNADDILAGRAMRPNYSGLLSVEEVGRLARERWIYPRARRRPEFVRWSRDSIHGLLAGQDSERRVLARPLDANEA
jgi:hypothetical protein